MRVERGLVLVALVLLALVTGCATGGGMEGGAGEVLVQVENNLTPSTSLTVWAVRLPSGSRQLLGTVAPRRTALLRFDPASGGQYRLVARPTAGNEIVSNPVNLTGAAQLRWDLRANLASVTEQRPE
jgi:hypothetical protein